MKKVIKTNNKGKTKFLTAGEVAKMLNIHIQSVYSAMKRGTLPIYTTMGGTIKLFHIDDIDKYKLNRKPGRPKTKQMNIPFVDANSEKIK